ncbi:hypothetical protein [Ramlibacter sp. 2FC]|uniref:hypothetical protein n=1 Tax=Ramlibacter sp. 2FC TaxID=2502188 RepID=UPI0010F799B4|nr:hypothetical protein [Ramlibacter sp. 2FC]
MYLVAIAWLYVALMMSVAEASHPDGTLLGAVITFLLYGVGPLALVLYIMGTPARRKALRAREAAATPTDVTPGSGEPDAGGQPAAAAERGLVAPEREKP